MSGYLSTCAMFAEWSGGASGQVFPTGITSLPSYFNLDHHKGKVHKKNEGKNEQMLVLPFTDLHKFGYMVTP